MITTVLRRKSRLAVLVVGAAVVLALLWTAASAQPQQPPFLLYGEGDPEDIVSVYDVDGQELGVVTVTSDGTWHVNVKCDSDNVQSISFRLNGDTVRAEIAQTGADQANVLLTPMSDATNQGSVGETAGTTDSDELTGEDEDLGDGSVDADNDLSGDEPTSGDGSVDADNDLSGDEPASGDGSVDADNDLSGDEPASGEPDASSDTSEPSTGSDEQAQNSGYPESGSGGLAETGPSTEALIGTIALLALVGVIAGLGAKMRRSRNRA